MTYLNADCLSRPTRALLICISEADFRGNSRTTPSLHALEANGAKLLDRWEKAELPAIFVQRAPAVQRERSFSMSRNDIDEGEIGAGFPTTDFSDSLRRPRPGDFVFESDLPSLLRHRRFNRLFEDLGGPLLILIGDDLADVVMQTAIDGFLAGHPIIIVKDAAPLGLQDADASSSSRAKSLPLLSCFARLMTTDELLNEWTTNPPEKRPVRRSTKWKR